MSMIYVLDACAMLAVLSNEEGALKVVDLYKKATSGKIKLIMHKFNLLEVYYDLYRDHGKAHADTFIDEINQSPIIINHELNDDIFSVAGRLKASYKISLVDSVALAQALVIKGLLVTSDHHEFDVIEQQENIQFEWIR